MVTKGMTRFGAAMGMTTSLVVQAPTMVMEDWGTTRVIGLSRPEGTVPKVKTVIKCERHD
jgi:hypothetical protein